MALKTPAPRIGIVPTYKPADNDLLISSRYITAIARAGGVPIVLPLTSDTTIYEDLFALLDGFVLSGGNDIDPIRYGEDSPEALLEGNMAITPERDEVETLILSYANRYDVPVLGICRGMQMINVFYGGTLYRDLDSDYESTLTEPARISHWQEAPYTAASHYVDIVPESHLGEIAGTGLLAANSMHHQGVKELAPALYPGAFGTDGLVEGVEDRGHSFIIGVQFHPEYFPDEPRMANIFTTLVQEGAKFHKRREELWSGAHIERAEVPDDVRAGSPIASFI